LFHPSANALVSAHYPRNPGMAIGLLAVGSGIGFFLGPQYAGWRAEAARWQLGGAMIADWQRPLLEAGAAGLVFSILFLLVAREAERRTPAPHDGALAPESDNGNGRAPPAGLAQARSPKNWARPLDPLLRRRLLGVSLTLMCRDFAGVASLTLASIYLQKAHALSTKHTGFIVGSMMLIGVIVNPLCVYLSPGKRRLPALAAVLAGAGVTVLAVPLVSVKWVLPLLCLFQACHLGSYAISEAAMLERVDPAVRGRVIGLFLSVAGTFASTAPWVMGYWTDALGEAAKRPLPYLWPFGLVGAFMLLATLSTPIIARLGEPTGQDPIRPMSEAMPGTLEPAG
jgi:hypothetical protein